jgi:hypothetical protein
MPVTAKLSRRFYEALGDDVANELVDWFNMVDATYRTELRELNDLNFARFDAKVGERFAEFEVRIMKQLAEMESRFDKRFADIDKRFVEIDKRFAEVDRRFVEQDGRIEKRIAESEARIEQRLGDLRADLIKWMFIFWATSALSVLGMLKL